MTDEISQNAISAAASRMFSEDELAQMSRPSRIAVGQRLEWVLKENPNPTDEELAQHRSELMNSHLHPAITAVQDSGQIDELTEQPTLQQPVKTDEELSAPKTPVPEDEFFIAVGRYEPDWLGSYVSDVIGYSIDKQGQLPSGKVQVTFSTLEQHPDQDEDDDDTYGYRFVCVVSYDEVKGRWVIEDHQEPVSI
ncbi:MAG: hypothetical protein HOL61_00230 [Rhodospirillaceae bacterium]|nr:hypothetical protein [Rhodospirillaceae bacterium]